MEELQPEELEELVQELEGESGAEEALSPEVELQLRYLEQAKSGTTRLRAAERLGKLRESSPRIVQSLIAAGESDSSLGVREAAVASLRAPAHQELLQEYPDLVQRAQSATEQAAIQRKRQREEQREKRREQQRENLQELEAELKIQDWLRRYETEAAEGAVQRRPSLPAPSELVLLHGDKFARTSSAAVKLGAWVRLVHIETDADAMELGENMLAASFLAVEQAGAVRLEVRRQQASFGLLNRDRLYVVPGEGAISWPSHSFESALRRFAANLQSQRDNHVSEIVYYWWMGREGRKSRFPWSRLGGLVKDGLVSRGLLQKERKSGLKGFFAGESYVLPAETAALATQQSIEPIEQLLATCRRTRPKVWHLLTKGINEGIRKCRKERDWD